MILNYILIGLYVSLWIYNGIILISIILSWIPGAIQSKVGSLFYEISNWLLRPFRGWLVIGFLDFSPVIGILALQFVMQFIYQLII